MARLNAIAALGCALALPLGLGGCAGALVVGGLAAAGGAGYVADSERGVDGTVHDFAIKNDLAKAFLQADPRLQSGITTSVYAGRVLLTGRVASPEMKEAAERIAGRIAHVRVLYDEAVVAPPESAWNDTKDAWITAEVRSKLIVDPGIRSVNYTIDTANGSVYLIGSARSQRELDQATRIARYVPGVKRVVSYVELRYGSPVAAIPAPQAPGGASGAYYVPSAGAAPEAPIEVQKL
jgi:osmotically-inducible protein OsmY